MATFQELTKTERNANWQKVFETIAQHEKTGTGVQDGAEEITLDSSELEIIRDAMSDNVREALAQDGEIQTAAEMKAGLHLKTKQKMEQFIQDQKAAALREREIARNPGITNDGYFNPVSGIGTFIDPGMATETFVPVSLTPNEATGYYTSGGIPARVIDKKAGCLSLNELKFKCDAFTPDEITQLEVYAARCGFNEAYAEGITQALIFGGAMVYPALKGDSPLTTQLGMKELLKAIPQEKDFIKYWVKADRWNVVYVPDYTITAQDYLHARTVFLPLGGIRVNTGRAAMIKPKKLPFWGAIKQMGWSTSDFEGWIKDFESYEIMKMSLPIMAQQMSLMYHQFPADGLIIENGPEYAKQFMKENEKEMRSWSMLNPKAINSIGEIKILERTYTGFQQLISESRLALCSASGIAESVLFAEKSTGLASDNRDDMELKQSETIRLLFKNVAPAFRNCIDLLVYSCFGKNSPQAAHAHEVTIEPDTGIVLSDQDRAQLGQSFTTIIGQLAAAGIPMETAVNIAQKFVPSADLSEEDMAAFTGAGEAEGIDQGLWDILNKGREIK